MTTEEIKNRFWMSVVGFDFSFAFVCFVLYYTRIPRGIFYTWYYMPLIILLGVVAGGLAAVVTWKKMSR
jgi:hypothetical protein